MYDHLGLKVGDLAASVRFYEAALSALGHELASRDDDGAGSAHRARRRCGSIAARRRAAARTWPSAHRTAPRSTASMPRA